jgi:hypothetical protein
MPLLIRNLVAQFALLLRRNSAIHISMTSSQQLNPFAAAGRLCPAVGG